MMRAVLATGIDWKDLEIQIRSERRKGHPIASRIHSLNLETGLFTLLLPDTDYDEETLEFHSDSLKAEPCVSIDIHLSARANVDKMHSQRKHHRDKVLRTEEAAAKAIAVAEKRAITEIGKCQEAFAKRGIQRLRRHFWFEKFHWFISSNNYLGIGGRDATQNEILYRRYLKKNDIYVHADIHGASSCIIKNPYTDGTPIPPKTLYEAGQMSICRSSAWESKMVTSAWWVHSTQVSKTAPTGEYLTTGAFMIRGKKNFLPPMKLEMGLGLLFQLGDDSIARHAGERCPTETNKGVDDIGTVKTTDIDRYAIYGDDNEPTIEAGRVVTDRTHAGRVVTDKTHAGRVASDTIDVEDKTIRSKALQQQTEVVDQDDTCEHEEVGLESDIDTSECSNDEITQQDEVTEVNEIDIAPKETSQNDLEVSGEAVTSMVTIYDISKTEKKQQHERLDDLYTDRKVIDMDDGATATPYNTKKYISRAQRRKLKSTKNDDTCHSVEEHIKTDDRLDTTKPTNVDSDGLKSKTNNVNVMSKLLSNAKRRQRNRLQKFKQKYAEQDEEERDAMMKLLGTKKMKIVEEMEKQTCSQRLDDNLVVEEISKFETKVEEEIVPAVVAVEQIYEKREIRELLEEEDQMVLEEDMKARLSQLDQLTGTPNATDDTLLFAVPVCAPYSAIQSYAFKVKIVPGSGKKGKTAQQCIKLFSHQSSYPSIKELIRIIQLPEMTNCIVGPSSISLPGFQKFKQQEKRLKKKERKKEAKDKMESSSLLN